MRVSDNWHITEIPIIMQKIERIAHDHRYTACAYGSVVQNGRGRDLDVMLVPKCPEDRGRGKILIDKIFKELNLISSQEYSLSDISGSGSIAGITTDERIIDFCVNFEQTSNMYQGFA